MRMLLDTNVLLRLAQPNHPQHQQAAGAVRVLLGRSDELLIVPQSLYEYWVVATRPQSANGLGLTPTQADIDIVQLMRMFTLLPELPTTFNEWRRLVLSHDVQGKNAHDARLVAAVVVHGVNSLLTFNDQDFRRFGGITVFTPAGVLATSP